MKYVIIPRPNVIHAVIDAATPEDAIIDFATTMDTDMNKYLMAMPEEEYTKYLAEQDAEAHKRFVIDWMESTLMNDFPIYDEDVAYGIAERAYDIYSEGNGDTEYEAVQKAYDEAHATKLTVSNIQWDWTREDIESLLSQHDTTEMLRLFKIDDASVANCELHEGAILDLCYDQLRHNRVTCEEVFDLPETIEVPSTLGDEQITEYLAEEYGYCVKGYSRSDDKEAPNA